MTNALPACSGVFLRANCPHPRLFKEKYTRSNRNRGTKILRCFPHCCPDHMDRSYCGSSLDVVLRFDPMSDVSQPVLCDQDSQYFAPFDIRNVHVFARFEVDGESSDGAFSLQYLRSISQSEENPEASWMEGIRCIRAKRQESIQQQQPSLRSIQNDECLQLESATFVLNSQSYAKWYYHWESGANIIQRETKHVLKAYVFYQMQVSGSFKSFHQQDATRLELLCIVKSPPFTVVSYRRSTLDASTDLSDSCPVGVYTTASMMLHYGTDAAYVFDTSLRRLVQRKISTAFQEYTAINQQCQESFCNSPSAETVDSLELKRHFASRNENYINQDLYCQFQPSEGWEFTGLRMQKSPALRSRCGRIQTFDQWLLRGNKSRRSIKHVSKRKREKDGKDNTKYDEGESHNEVIRPRSPFSTTEALSPADNSADLTPNWIEQQDNFAIRQQQNELQQLSDLSIIYFLASHVSFCGIKHSVRLELVLTSAISQHWQAASAKAADLAKFLLTVATREHRSSTDFFADDTSQTKEKDVLLVVAECDSIGVGAVYRDGNRLRTAYLTCVGRYWGALDDFLRKSGPTYRSIRSVRELSDAVLGVVFSDPGLRELRSGLRNKLQQSTINEVVIGKRQIVATDFEAYIACCDLAGWQGFVAQVREGYLRQQIRVQEILYSPNQQASIQSWRWKADYSLRQDSLIINYHTRKLRRDPHEAQVRCIEDMTGVQDQDVPSIWSSCHALSQLLRITLAGAGDPLHTLYIQAYASVLPKKDAWLQLLCDAQIRVAPIALNGLTSLLGGSSYEFGEFYWWPAQNENNAMQISTAFRCVTYLRIAIGGEFMEGVMNLERGIVSREAIMAAGVSDLKLLTPVARVQTVTYWEPWLSTEAELLSTTEHRRGSEQLRVRKTLGESAIVVSSREPAAGAVSVAGPHLDEQNVVCIYVEQIAGRWVDKE
ncbi:uncharacterized protein PHALS_11259 [Plasmopara halstedii]|uniref:Uncharacterized protein n=1 Tax=Plasmopara halstedii TaxID=4781 RepID=A0A0P1AKF1_PLAHL|nr:uncharacterized protein PHALS_11259 [Plasmopara halstedii]CEG41092.1 hypothetical protein PHALS_11259 [Plasmopara halstedii]|eukprot:XP_024577461.1 hypothetical protein PHALS_11259 [Plasmopara halstedii]